MTAALSTAGNEPIQAPHYLPFPSHCSSTLCRTQRGCYEAVAKVTWERSLGELAGEAEFGHPLTRGYFSSSPSKPWLVPCTDKDNLLLHGGSCLGSAPWRTPEELHQGLCPSSSCSSFPISTQLGWAGLGGVSPSYPQLPSMSLAQLLQGTTASVMELGSAAINGRSEVGTEQRSGEELH